MLRFVEKTRSSSSRKRSERGQEVLAGRRVVYPWPEKLGLQLVEKSPSNAEFKQPAMPAKHLVQLSLQRKPNRHQ